MRDREPDGWPLEVLLLVIVCGVVLWAMCFAPCGALGCMAVKDLPARCLDVRER